MRPSRWIAASALLLAHCGPMAPMPPGDDAGAPPADAAPVPPDAPADPPADATPGPTDGAATSPLYEAARTVLVRRCATVGYCHEGSGTGTGSARGLAEPYSALVNRPAANAGGMLLVVPGQPDASYLMHKAAGTLDAIALCETGGRAACGDPMPPPASRFPTLTPDELAALRAWIEAGAPGPAAR